MMVSRAHSILVILAALGVVVAAWAYHAPIEQGNSTRLAEEIVASCAATSDKEGCYEEVIPALYPQLPIPAVFDVVRAVRTIDSEYQFCHLLAHKIGSVAIADDPSHWLSAFPLNPKEGLCSNGFLHGVMIERFRDAVFDEETFVQALPELSSACKKNAYWDPTRLDKGMCYHGLGHLAVSLTDADIRRALTLCRQVVAQDPDYLLPCQEGVFMQLFQPVEPDDYDLVRVLAPLLTKESYRGFCAQFPDAGDRGACLREAWPLFTKDILTGNGVEKFCSGQPGRREGDACYTTVATIIGRILVAHPEKAIAACRGFPVERRAECFSLGATTIVEEDRERVTEAVARCEMSEEENACLTLLAERMQYMQGEKELDMFCEKLPYAYHSVCMTGGGAKGAI